MTDTDDVDDLLGDVVQEESDGVIIRDVSCKDCVHEGTCMYHHAFAQMIRERANQTGRVPPVDASDLAVTCDEFDERD